MEVSQDCDEDEGIGDNILDKRNESAVQYTDRVLSFTQKRIRPQMLHNVHNSYSNPHPEVSLDHMQFQCQDPSGETPEMEVYLPIKKRRLKELLSHEEALHHGNMIIDYSSSSHSAAIDCSEEWWYFANQEWSRAKTHASRSSRCISNTSNNAIEKLIQYSDSVTPSETKSSNMVNPNDSLPDSINKVSIYDKNDPRSEEYQKWLKSFYPNGFLPHRSNPILVKMNLVNPTLVGNKFPPWVKPEGLKKWDISKIGSQRVSFPSTSKIQVKKLTHFNDNHQNDQTSLPKFEQPVGIGNNSTSTSACNDIFKRKDSNFTLCKTPTVISYVGHAKPYEINN